MRRAPPRLIAITPTEIGLEAAARAAGTFAELGVGALLLRGLTVPEAAWPLLLRVLHRSGRPESLLIRPGTEWETAFAADEGLGLHLPAHQAAAPWRDRVSGLLGQSCHDQEGLARAADAGCDYAFLSPIWPAGSKNGDLRPPLGLVGLAAALEMARLPVLALGGIDPERARAAMEVGAYGAAGIGAFFTGTEVDPQGACALLAAVHSGAATPAREKGRAGSPPG